MMTHRAVTIFALVGATLHVRACGSSASPAGSCARRPSASAARSGGPTFVAVLGSSTPAGYGLPDRSQSWVGLYAAHLSSVGGLQVQNLAVEGYTTFHVLPTGTPRTAGRPAVDEEHNVTAALAYRPKAIIVNLPSNDAAMGASVEESLRNLRLVVDKAGEAGVSVWVTTTQPRVLDRRGTELLFALRDRVKQEFGARALDFWTPLASPDGAPVPAYNQGDGVHPNASGHRLLFAQVKLADLPGAVARESSADAAP
jgi:lysophospholipase L1-like esterase